MSRPVQCLFFKSRGKCDISLKPCIRWCMIVLLKEEWLSSWNCQVPGSLRRILTLSTLSINSVPTHKGYLVTNALVIWPWLEPHQIWKGQKQRKWVAEKEIYRLAKSNSAFSQQLWRVIPEFCPTVERGDIQEITQVMVDCFFRSRDYELMSSSTAQRWLDVTCCTYLPEYALQEEFIVFTLESMFQIQARKYFVIWHRTPDTWQNRGLYNLKYCVEIGAV